MSSLSKEKWKGPNISVPKQIEVQSKFDNVFWYNINNLIIDFGNVKCHSLSEYPTLKITDLPKPFNKPDLVIFEGVYFASYLKIALDCRRNKIPYIIIPRCSLTAAAQKSKALKKKIGNMLFFNYFTKNAIAIQYLTYQEYIDSGDKWNKNVLIIPNGIEKKNRIKKSFNNDKIKGIFVGRLDIYHKGLDLLLKACYLVKDQLEINNCEIDIYGPSIKNSKEKLYNELKSLGLEKIINLKEPILGQEKEKKLLDSDFFILTSRFEGLPMALLEAISYGLPCLVTTGSNMADEIKNADAGWVSETDINGIAKAFKQLLNEKKEFIKKSENALKLSIKYDWENIAKLSHEKYLNLLKK